MSGRVVGLLGGCLGGCKIGCKGWGVHGKQMGWRNAYMRGRGTASRSRLVCSDDCSATQAVQLCSRQMSTVPSLPITPTDGPALLNVPAVQGA